MKLRVDIQRRFKKRLAACTFGIPGEGAYIHRIAAAEHCATAARPPAHKEWPAAEIRDECGEYGVRVCRCFTAHLVTVIALLAGCATTLSDRAAKVADTDDASVAGCGFVGQVQGYSGRGNLAVSTGRENAKNEARREAAKLGATDIVWKPVSVSYSPYVSGVAYDCNSPRP